MAASSVTFDNALTRLLKVKYPIFNAGMYSVAGHELAAAVTNAGGIGTIGGLAYTPKTMRQEIRFVRELLEDQDGVFGVDLLIPKVGDGARATNYDYTKGSLAELIQVLVEEKVKLFICAVGVPPKWAVDQLHAGGVVCMNMIGDPGHVAKALDVGMDIICAQGTEAGGHTGDIATSVLIPQCADLCRGRTNFFGTPVPLVAAGGIYDGRGLSAMLCFGAHGVWVGTRFIASAEAAASPIHKQRVLDARSKDTRRSIIFTGRPARVLNTDYVKSWEDKRPDEVRSLVAKGIVPFEKDAEEGKANISEGLVAAMGQCAGAVKEVLPAAEIVRQFMQQALASLDEVASFRSKL